jgi:hypothetical protein
MKLKDLRKLDLEKKTLEEDIYVNPLQVLASDEFNKKPTIINGKDYRERAIDRALALKVAFHNEDNTTYELVKRLIKVTCPHCHRLMECKGGGGCGHTTSSEFRCKDCNTIISLSLSNDDGIAVRYQE